MYLAKRLARRRTEDLSALTTVEEVWRYLTKDRADILRLLATGYLDLVAFALTISIAHAEQPALSNEIGRGDHALLLRHVPATL